MENREQETGNGKLANGKGSLSLGRLSIFSGRQIPPFGKGEPEGILQRIIRTNPPRFPFFKGGCQRGRALRTALLAATMIAAPALAQTVDLDDFLRGTEEAARVAVPLRAEGQFEVVSPEATRRDEIALVMRPPGDTFIELRQGAVRALLLGDGAFRIMGRAAKAERFPLDASLDDSDFTREDLEPFRGSHYKDARISDDSATELMVTFFPANSQYSLVVITFDRQKKVPLKIQYYRDTVNNLVKMQRLSDYVLVGDKWSPATISMETFKLRTHTAMKLRWTPQPNLPADLFNPASLTRASLALWPTAPARP